MKIPNVTVAIGRSNENVKRFRGLIIKKFMRSVSVRSRKVTFECLSLFMRHKYKEGEERGQSFLLLVLEFELFSNTESRIAYLLPEESSCKGYSCGGMIVLSFESVG